MLYSSGMDFRVLHEDNHLLAVAKPAGLLVQGDRSGDLCLVEAAKDYLRHRYGKPGNVYLGLVHRLDRNVSGVVLLARTSKAASRLSEQFRQKSVRKIYLAVTEGLPDNPQGELTAWLARNGDARGVTRASLVAFAASRESLLRYEVLESAGGCSLIKVEPVTGRRHQIRAQLALIGCPLLGDVKYGAARGLPDHRLGLHAWQLAIKHPVAGDAMTFTADPPRDWPWPLQVGK